MEEKNIIDTASEKLLSVLFSRAGIEVSESETADIVIRNRAFHRHVLTKGSIGLGDSYINGEWDSAEIDSVVYKILTSGIYQKLALVYDFIGMTRRSIFNMQDREKAREVIEEHYDLPIEIYKAFLDPYFQYTCARFEGTDDLDEAQRIKMDNICKKLGLKEGDEVMDLGGGWGGLAQFMKEEYGANPTVVTLSKEQADYIRKTHGEKIGLELCDYREMPPDFLKKFDAIAMVGMLEHVGVKNYEELAEILNQNIKVGGKILIHSLYTPYSIPATNPWVHKHIFPNGELASHDMIQETFLKHFSPASGEFESFEELTPNYPPTLRAWKQKLSEAREKGEITMSDAEYRKWKYYFMSYAGAIDAKHVRVGQFLFEKKR